MWWARAGAILHKSWCHVRLKLPSPRKRLHLKFPNFGGREVTTGNTSAVRRLARQRTGPRLVEHWWHLSIKIGSYWVFVTRILIFRGYCFWPALWCKSIFFDLFWNVRLILRLNKVLGCLIFSKVPPWSDFLLSVNMMVSWGSCNVLLRRAQLVFFAGS